ncbi:MAG TPA: Uma2 family endonuclease [Xanthobacteraceae bacterium]|jgi:Uma2 family endonuclease|nr:Uma2 family endonuclease [Xanthobacteraceae bacterium]
MNVVFRRAMTVDEYLAWCESQSERQRTELINGQIVTMPAERLVHSRVKGSAFMALHRAIQTADLSCEAMTDGPGLRIDDHTVYEPDALVYCGARPAPDAMLIPNPVIIVEVLSPTTRHSDTSAKLIGYFKLPSVAHYLVLDPDARTGTHHVRDGVPSLLSDGTLRLDPPGLSVTVEDLLGPT